MYVHRSLGRGGARTVAVTRARESDPLVLFECWSGPVEPSEMPREASFCAFFAFIASIRARLSAVAVGLELILWLLCELGVALADVV